MKVKNTDEVWELGVLFEAGKLPFLSMADISLDGLVSTKSFEVAFSAGREDKKNLLESRVKELESKWNTKTKLVLDFEPGIE
jgi:hypothetical protein